MALNGYVHSQIKEETIMRSYAHIPPLLTKEEYKGHDDVCFCRDGEHFIVISDSANLSLFKTDGCSFVAKIPNKKYGCSRCCFHPLKQEVYVNSKIHVTDHDARLISIREQRFVRYFSGHAAHITTLAAWPSGMVTASRDRTVRFWDENKQESVAVLEYVSAPNVAIHPNGHCVAIACASSLSLHDLRNLSGGPVISTKLGLQTDVIPYFGFLGKSLMLVGQGIATEYNLTDLSVKLQKVEGIDGRGMPGFCYSGTEDFLLVPTGDNDILVADAGSGSQVTVLSGHESPVARIAMSSAYHSFVSVGKECLFWTVDVQTFNLLVNPRSMATS
jgi:WD40 repeat protein